MINVEKEHNLPTKTQINANNIVINVIFCCGCVTNVYVEKK